MTNDKIHKSSEFEIRRFRKSDCESLVQNINNKKIYDMTSRIPYPYTYKMAIDWIDYNLKLYGEEKNQEINFVIDIGGDLIGSIGFFNIVEGTAEIAYWLAEKYWNKGIMSKVLKIVIDHGFNTLGLNEIVAKVFTFNKSSIKILKKTNFVEFKILYKNVQKDGKKFDEYIFKLKKIQ